jgi:prolyl oligopeptidase
MYWTATNVIKVAEVNPTDSGVEVTPRGTVALPAASTVIGADARFKNKVSFVKVTSPLMPGNSYRLEPTADGTLSCTEWYRISVAGFNSDDFEARQEFVPSADGSVKLPMFVVRSKAASTASPQPTLLYAYGGFNVSLQPTFSATRLLWISQLKATYALAM